MMIFPGNLHSSQKQAMANVKFLWLSLISLQLFQHLCCSTPYQHVKILSVSPDGVNNITCLSESKPKCSLMFALRFVQQMQKQSSAEVHLDPGNYDLTQSFNFTSLSKFVVVGNSSDPDDVKIRCAKDVFISMEKSGKISLERFTLEGCGHRFHFNEVLCEEPPNFSPYPKNRIDYFHAAILIMNSDDLSLLSTVIANSYGIGLKLCNVGENPKPNVNPTVKMNNASFIGNNIPQTISDKLIFDTGYQGGGVNLDLSLKYPAHDTSYYQFVAKECKFSNNVGGSGISVLLWNNTQDVTITVDTCEFVSNKASFGGGVFLEFHNQVQHSKLIIKDSIFNNNTAKYGGGAIRTGINTDTKTIMDKRGNSVLQERCKFFNNSAKYGGAASHYQSFYYPFKTTDRRNSTTFSNCEFVNNQATMGSAIGFAGSSPISYILESNYRKAFEPYHAVIQDCNFTDNQMIIQDDIIGVGALYSFAVPTIFVGRIMFERNTATAVVIDSAFLRVFGDGIFNNNTGLEGGALALYGDSKLIMMENSSLYFSKNKAEEKGGAVFVRISGPPVLPFDTTQLNTRTCFLGYNNNFDINNVNNWKTKITFDNNRAPLTAGLAIYANTLQGCRRNGEPRLKHKAMEWKFVHYHDDNNTHSNISYQISTDPLKIVFDISDWHVAPTEKFNVNVQLRDEKDSLAYGIIRVMITDIKESQVHLTTSPLFLVQDNSKIPNLRLNGHKKSNFSVQLRSVGGQIVHSRKKSQTMKPCNPGYYQKVGSDQCNCMKKIIDGRGIYDCLNDGKTIYIREGYWAGMVGSTFASYPCPHHFCQSGNNGLVGSFIYDKSKMCDKNRNESSVLCGSCKNGYSVSLGNESCLPGCSNNHLWLLVPFFVGMLILVLLILRIDVDIFTVYLNAWLYSYQVILFLQKEGQKFDPVLAFIIGIANWQFKGVATCVFNGMNNLTKLYINYILPVYVLALLVVVAKIARYIRNCYISRNVFRAFSTLLVLCYTNITMISFYAVHYVSVGGHTVLYVDGDIDFHRDWKTHIPLTIIALFWIIFFVALLPLMLLITPWFLHHVRYTRKFRAIFDIFQSCYKDEYRWFAAFYFICRIAVLVVRMFVPSGPLQRALLEMLCVIILVVCVYYKPYNDDYQHFNYLDAILLSNLCFFTIFSSAVNSEATENVQNALQKYVLEISAYVPLIYLVVLLVIIIWRCCREEEGPDRRQYENLESSRSVTESETQRTSENAPI